MSSKRLVVVAAAAQATRPGPPPGQQPLRGEQRPPAFNLLVISGVLGAVLLVAGLACWCRRGRGRGRADKAPPPACSVYTLAADCPYHAQCYESPAPPYRRPPTPGPPPAYDSVVSLTDQLRRFGNDEDYSDDIDKLRRYVVDDVGPSREAAEDAASGLDKLRHYKVQGSCTCYEENREMRDESSNIDTTRTDVNDGKVVVYRHDENVDSESSGSCAKVEGVHILIDVDRECVRAPDHRPNSNNPEKTIVEEVGKIVLLPAESGQITSSAESREEPGSTPSSQSRDTTGPVEDTTEERDNSDDALPSYEAAVTLQTKCQNKNREEGR